MLALWERGGGCRGSSVRLRPLGPVMPPELHRMIHWWQSFIMALRRHNKLFTLLLPPPLCP
jgi:hypothetical protein